MTAAVTSDVCVYHDVACRCMLLLLLQLLQVFTYGAPMMVRDPTKGLFERVLATAVVANDRLHCFMNVSDPVPRIFSMLDYAHETACGQLSSFYVPTEEGDTEKLSDARRAVETTKTTIWFPDHFKDAYVRWMTRIAEGAPFDE